MRKNMLLLQLVEILMEQQDFLIGKKNFPEFLNILQLEFTIESSMEVKA